MGERKYIPLNCRSLGHDCDFQIRAETEEEALHFANDHLGEIDDICAFDSELKVKISNSRYLVPGRTMWLLTQDQLGLGIRGPKEEKRMSDWDGIFERVALKGD